MQTRENMSEASAIAHKLETTDTQTHVDADFYITLM